MELWIRSQDRTFLRKVNTIGIVEGRDFWSIDENLTVSFGKYKTKERALEVLDEIQNIIYINKLFNADINAFQKSLEIEGYTEKEIAQALKTISTYEMPKN